MSMHKNRFLWKVISDNRNDNRENIFMKLKISIYLFIYFFTILTIFNFHFYIIIKYY